MPSQKKSHSNRGRVAPVNSQRFAIAILAAGKGTRLKSQHPKVLHEIAGRPLLGHVIAAASAVVPPSDIFAIIGHEADRVRRAVDSTGVNFIEQKEQRGTGHAIMQCRDALRDYDHVLVLSGDVPLIRPETIAKVREAHLHQQAAMTILTAQPPDPFGYGRILRLKHDGRETDHVSAIVEQKSLLNNQVALAEVNSGIYAFAVAPLFRNIDRLSTDNPHHEFYLTDMAAILVGGGESVLAVRSDDWQEVLGVNTRAELAYLDSLLRARKCQQLMNAGVSIFKPETCVIDAEVTVGPDTVIEPFVQLLGSTSVGSECRLRSYSVVTNSRIADNVLIRHGCILEDATVESGAILGPYSHLRPQSVIGENAHVGNFVETKKTKLGRGAKANHLTYLGDAEIGAGVNVGAGTITCNYDGVNKHTTVVEEGAFIGSDTTLVAPVRVGRGAYVGAASCITQDVPEDSLAIARGQQVVKDGWAKRRREERGKAGKA
ncbi:MAG TPA: bifunctional UDP-N-acetylglucosamine diphosphorylase/glucosamine-1-phosphate N-acetyltransferase GlmU [Clostridia bacterium]|nr:bifunctional UDP-N-acetylglucosamine diphosphorylase/glucosamine-1-phosphate N-acetyltransferase GlmU [Clostridia bacterium]